MNNLITEDSTGATEVASSETGEEIQETGENPEVSKDVEGVGENTNSEELENESEEVEVYDFGDFQASRDELNEWKEAHNRKSEFDKDYTTKSQANAETRKRLEAKESDVDSKLELLSSIEAEIDDLLLGDLKNIDQEKYLDEYGSDAYAKLKLKIDKAKGTKALFSQKLKKAKEASIVESQKVLSEMLGWSDAEKHKSDVQSINEYVTESGMPVKEFNKVDSPHVIQAFLEAKKYRELMQKKAQAAKKVAKAPTVSKSTKKASSSKPKSLAERMYGNSMNR